MLFATGMQQGQKNNRELERRGRWRKGRERGKKLTGRSMSDSRVCMAAPLLSSRNLLKDSSEARLSFSNLDGEKKKANCLSHANIHFIP